MIGCSMELNVVCCLWGDWFDLGGIYVEKLFSMVSRHLNIPFTFFCLTTKREAVSHIKDIVIIDMPKELEKWDRNLPKFYMYNKELPIQGKVLFFDLDSIIMGSLNDLVNSSDEFIGIKPWRSKNWKKGWFLGSVLFWLADGRWSFMWDAISSDPIGWGEKTKTLKWDGRERIALMFLVGNKGTYFQDIFPDHFIPFNMVQRNELFITDQTKVICFHGRNYKPHLFPEDPIVQEHWK